MRLHQTIAKAVAHEERARHTSRIHRRQQADRRIRFRQFCDLLDGEDISEDQERELLQVLFSILCQFVELGYAVDICGHFEKTLRSDARPDPVALEST